MGFAANGDGTSGASGSGTSTGLTVQNGMFTLQSGALKLQNTAYKIDESAGAGSIVAVMRPLLPISGSPTFEELKASFDAAVAEGATRWAYQVQGISWGLNKMPDGEWSIAAWKYAGVAGVGYPLCKCTNDAANPMFVTYTNGTEEAFDPSAIVLTYQLIDPIYMRCVNGANATLEFITPLRFRSIEFLFNQVANHYVMHPLNVEVTYGDSTVINFKSLPYNNGYYISDSIDQTKSVAKVKYMFDSANVIGDPSTLRIDAVGNAFKYGSAEYLAGQGTPVCRVTYLYGYNHHFISERFNQAERDITADFVVTSSLAAARGFPISNMTDGNPATYYQTSTNVGAVTLTFTKLSTVLAGRFVNRIVITLPLITGNELVLTTLQSLVAAGFVASGSDNYFSNTRHYRNPAAQTFTFEIDAGMPTTMQEAIEVVTLALTKENTTKPHAITSVQLFGY